MVMVSATRKYDSARQAGDAFLGVEVSWDMGDLSTDMTIPRAKFVELFQSAGVSKKFFREITIEGSLLVAAGIGWSAPLRIDSKTISVKQLSKPDKDTPLAFGVYYRISGEGERDRWELGARVRVQEGRAVVCPPQDEIDYPSESARKWGEAMAEYAEACKTIAFNHHISHSLRDLGEELGWISRRVNGGVYFLPGDAGEKFMAVLDGLELLTAENPVHFEGSAIPQYADPRTLQTWQRRTKQTFADEIAELTAKLKDMSGRDNARESTFDLRIFECISLIDRADQYSAILQEHLEPLKTAVNELKGQFVQAKKDLLVTKYKADTAFSEVQAFAGGPAKADSPGPAKVAPPVVKARTKASLDQLFAV